MVQKKAPQIPGAIQVRLAHLQDRKAALDTLIASLERYAVYQIPVRKPPASERVVRAGRRLAGAA
jgi:hypothetical protein